MTLPKEALWIFIGCSAWKISTRNQTMPAGVSPEYIVLPPEMPGEEGT
jgi:hypothetical protein